jgi:hypothetical protein
MIISYKYNFIYFRPKKTGSSTIAAVLRANLGIDDVDHKDQVWGEEKERAHTEASEIRDMVPRKFWKSAFKFTSERHPYEKAVSLTYYRMGKHGKSTRAETSSFEEMLDKVISGEGYCGYRYYSINGRPIVDDFIRQENLMADLKRIGEKLGLAIPDELPRRKGQFREDMRPAREILSAEQRDIIYEKCKPEFELLGYER